MRMPVKIASLLLLLFLLGCEGGTGKKPERNVLKEYVKEPQEKAHAVRDRLEGAQDSVRRQSDSLLEEDE